MAFKTDIATDVTEWLLVVTSDCPACLGLDSELEAMKHMAACRKSRLRPLVIRIDSSTASIHEVLTRHGLEVAGVAEGQAFASLHLRAAPTLMRLDPGGRVGFVTYPGSETWPPAPGC